MFYYTASIIVRLLATLLPIIMSIQASPAALYTHYFVPYIWMAVGSRALWQYCNYL